MIIIKKKSGIKSKISLLGCGWLGIPLAVELKNQGFKIYGSTTKSEKIEILKSSGVSKIFVGKLEPQWLGDDISSLLDTEYLVLDFPPGKNTEEDFHKKQMEAIYPFIGLNTKVIYTSSTSIYSENGKEVFEDDITTIEQSSHRKIMKAEVFLKEKLKDRLTILRCGGLAGWDRNLAKFFAGKSNLEGKGLPVNLVHGEDVVKAILFIINNHKFGETYNVVAPKHPSKEEYYTDLCKKSNLPLPEFSDIMNEIRFKIVNSDKIQRAGFAFLHPDPMNFLYKNDQL